MLFVRANRPAVNRSPFTSGSQVIGTVKASAIGGTVMTERS